MPAPSKNKFPLRVKRELLSRGLSVAALARVLGRPPPTASHAIHSQEFPHVRAAVIAHLFP